MFEAFVPILAVLIALLLGAMSPGPSLVYVAQKAAKQGRRSALMTAVGMGLGGMAFATLSLLGLGAVIAIAPNVFFVLRLVGAAYLAFLAFKIWKHAREPFDFEPDGKPGPRQNSLLGGLAIQVANPKTIIVYSSVFVAALPNGTDVSLAIVLVLLVFLLEFGWYGIVALVFSSSQARAGYAKAKTSVDRTAACAMGGLATKVAWDAVRSVGLVSAK